MNVIENSVQIAYAVKRLTALGSEVSLFIDADEAQIDAAIAVGASTIEIHTGCYADAITPALQNSALQRIQAAAYYAKSCGLIVNAGHGLHYHNVQAIAAIQELHELNIGHAIIARALFSGLQEAVKTMLSLIQCRSLV